MKSMKCLPIVCALFAANTAAETQWGVGVAAISSNECCADGCSKLLHLEPL